MNWHQVKRQWPLVQDGIKRTWGRIDEADLKKIHGDRDRFVKILANKYGYSDEVARTKVDDFIDRLPSSSSAGMRYAWMTRLLRKLWRNVHVAKRG